MFSTTERGYSRDQVSVKTCSLMKAVVMNMASFEVQKMFLKRF